MPYQRLVVRGWCTLGELEHMMRQEVVDACLWLDAVEAAEAVKEPTPPSPKMPRR